MMRHPAAVLLLDAFVLIPYAFLSNAGREIFA